MIVDLDDVVLDVNGNVSNWVAVGNPVVYKLQRQDFIFDQINDNGGFVQLQFNTIDLTSLFAVDDIIYIKSDNGVYSIAGQVTAESFSTNTLITTDIPYVSAAPGGLLNNDTLRPSYRIEVEVYDLDDNLLTPSPYTSSPNTSGLIIIDVSSIIRLELRPDIDADLTGSTEVFNDTNSYQGFYIKYREVWTGSAESQTTDDYEFYGVLGARQIPSQHGGNMFEYVSFENGADIGLFLTRLSRPKMYKGFPFLISCICGDNLTAEVWLSVEYYDSNGDSLGSDVTPTEFHIGQLIIFNVTETMAIPDSAVTAELKLFFSGGGYELLEPVICDIVNPCQNPVMLMGRNSLGGVLQWLFEVSQEEDFNYQEDIKRKRQVLSVAGLSKNEWDALQDFITLGEVYKENIVEFTSETIKSHSRIGQQLYVVDQEGNKIGVIAIPTNNKTLTKLNQHYFEIEIEYPETFAP